ncbi:type II secretion system protein [Helicobacter didelphidarum]|uniref:Type II secretion system protein n=1 Tax=Helicobacter didelphidarum TaxID=2040648 RepID=A0A3D8ILX9_9HELI|nr:type II secretion system protein [Helicobacter didelphidarum]RDU66238.1 type II secretion system protein [Helicobacter didelphidarum]
MRHVLWKNTIQNHLHAFSLIEVLFVLVTMGILGVTTLKSLTALKKQNHNTQKFLTQHGSLFETSLFINKNLSISKPDSIKITPNSLEWKGYTKLFLQGQNNADYMNFSLQTEVFSLERHNNNLFFNNTLLLKNVREFEVKIIKRNADSILEYKLCTNICVQDFIFIEESEIAL